MTRLWLVSYDISDHRSRQRVHNILKDYGQRVQLSVFECHLDARQWDALRTRLLPELDSADSVRWYPLCVWCSGAVSFQGVGSPPLDEGFFLQ